MTGCSPVHSFLSAWGPSRHVCPVDLGRAYPLIGVFDISMMSFTVEEFFVELIKPCVLANSSCSSFPFFDETVVQTDFSHFCLLAVG